MVRMVLAGILVLLSLAGGAAAQEPYPTRPITLVVPYPPGGSADLTSRPFAPALERALKQPVVILNKPGAGGAVGTNWSREKVGVRPWRRSASGMVEMENTVSRIV